MIVRLQQLNLKSHLWLASLPPGRLGRGWSCHLHRPWRSQDCCTQRQYKERCHTGNDVLLPSAEKLILSAEREGRRRKLVYFPLTSKFSCYIRVYKVINNIPWGKCFSRVHPKISNIVSLVNAYNASPCYRLIVDALPHRLEVDKLTVCERHNSAFAYLTVLVVAEDGDCPSWRRCDNFVLVQKL